MMQLRVKHRQAAVAVLKTALAEGPSILRDPPRPYAVESHQQSQRGALLISLVAAIPAGHRFTSAMDVATWCMAEMQRNPNPTGISEVTRLQVNYIAGQMWAALEEAGGAEFLHDHSAVLADVARSAHRGFYRELRAECSKSWGREEALV